MTTWLVSRHPGAQVWINRQGIKCDRVVSHLDTSQVRAGDTVIGTLPMQAAAQIHAQDATYLHLTVALPASRRGTELSADDLDALGAQLRPCRVELGEAIENPPHS